MTNYADAGAALKQLAGNINKANGATTVQAPHRGSSPITPSTSAQDLTTWLSSALSVAKSQIRGGATTSTQVTPGTTVIDLPAGTYTVSQAKGLLGSENLAQQGSGLAIRGAGEGLTTILFNATSPGDLMWTRYWQDVHIEGITFVCSTSAAGSTFLHGVNASASAGQHFTFDRCSWIGPWKYLFLLEGDNNLSEFTWNACSSSGVQDGGAWLRIPTTGSDQMLNYCWTGVTKHWSTSAPLIDADLGGHFTVDHLDASDFAHGSTGTQRHLFYLRGSTHARGVTSFKARLRVEGKSTVAGLLYSEWDAGNIDLEVDYSSQVDSYTYGEIIQLAPNSADHATVHVHDSQLAGLVGVTYGDNAWAAQHRIIFERCQWLTGTTPTDVVAYHATGSNTTLKPRVEFVRCRGANSNSLGTAGYAPWDATVGYARESGPLDLRRIQLAGPWGGLGAGDTGKIILPLGALVTGVKVMYGADSNAVSGTITLATTDSTPVAAASLSVSSAANAGFSASSMNTPFRCDTATRATLTITGLAALPTDALVTIEGYW